MYQVYNVVRGHANQELIGEMDGNTECYRHSSLDRDQS